MKKTIILLAALATMMSCQKNDMHESVQENDVINASIEKIPSTKTSLDTNKDVLWSDGDQLTIFKYTTLGLKYEIMEQYAGRNYGSFSKVSSGNDDVINAGSTLKHLVAYYPYGSDIEIKADNNENPTGYTLTNITIPEYQEYAEESFANGSFPMVSISEDNNVTFKNVFGGLKLQLKGTKSVSEIIVYGNNKEQLSGTASVKTYVYGKEPTVQITDGYTAVALQCGSGRKLDAKAVTNFIISLPPVTFSKGFSVVVFFTDGTREDITTNKSYTIERSTLLTMDSIDVDSEEIPVTSVELNFQEFHARVGNIFTIRAYVSPADATNPSVKWSSNNKGVATVDEYGNVTAIAEGTASITATSGQHMASCEVTVSEALNIKIAKYIDQDNVDHGYGILIGNTVWAPVNCGYHVTDYPYGKLYQWGRIYGQGYDGDATYPSGNKQIIKTESGVSLITSIQPADEGIFYLGFGTDEETPHDWTSEPNNTLWNSGKEDTPQRNKVYDPCPSGWRVPTKQELSDLGPYYSGWTTNEAGQNGFWFYGKRTASETTPKIFLPAAGYRNGRDGSCGERAYGYYWSSYGASNGSSYCLHFSSYEPGYLYGSHTERSNGYSVRCVQVL